MTCNQENEIIHVLMRVFAATTVLLRLFSLHGKVYVLKRDSGEIGYSSAAGEFCPVAIYVFVCVCV